MSSFFNELIAEISNPIEQIRLISVELERLSRLLEGAPYDADTILEILDKIALKEDKIYSINAQGDTTYVLELADSTKLVTLENASPITVTVPLNATVPFAIGTRINFIQKGAGKVTFAGAVGVTIKSKSNNKSIGAQDVAVSLIKESADVWYLIGDLIA